MTPKTRKTLEACAKVSGYEFKYIDGHFYVKPEEAKCEWRKWAPSESVADAAEMAIKLKIDVTWHGGTCVEAENQDTEHFGYAIFKDHPSEQLAYCYAVCKVAEQLAEVM